MGLTTSLNNISNSIPHKEISFFIRTHYNYGSCSVHSSETIATYCFSFKKNIDKSFFKKYFSFIFGKTTIDDIVEKISKYLKNEGYSVFVSNKGSQLIFEKMVESDFQEKIRRIKINEKLKDFPE
jgi:hypothetical protein